MKYGETPERVSCLKQIPVFNTKYKCSLSRVLFWDTDNITDTDSRQGIKDYQSFNFIAAIFFI